MTLRIVPLLLSLSLIGLAGAATGVQAQAGQIPRPAPTERDLLLQLPPGARIRLVSHGVRVIASNPKVVGDSLVAIIGAKTWTLALADIDTVWVKKGSRAALGAAITGVPAAIWGAGLGYVLATDPDSNRKPGGGLQAALVGGTIFGLIGAIPGALLGSVITRWARIYVRGAPPS